MRRVLLQAIAVCQHWSPLQLHYIQLHNLNDLLVLAVLRALKLADEAV